MKLWMIPVAALVVVNLTTFAAYGLDKRAAVRDRRRISEARLHMLALLGGFPAAWIGQQVLRHKRRKGRFMLIFWSIVALHAAGWTTLAVMRYR